MSRPFHVLVAVPTASHLSREFARGVARFACVQDNWDTRFLPGREDDFPVAELKPRNFDGVIATDLLLPASFLATSIPIIRLWGHREKKPPEKADLVCITADESLTGRSAADYFIQRGFRHFAFAGGLQPGLWSDLRERFFKEALEKRGYDCAVYPRGHLTTIIRNAKNDEARMCRWLKDLPKPVGIFAAYDRRGCQIIRCCKKASIEIPGEVAVIGVDNDPFFCESVSPALSSIRQSMEETGFTAAATLARMMEAARFRKPYTPPELRTTFQEVVTRGSSDIHLAPNDTLVARAQALLVSAKPIIRTVRELSERLGVSERLLRLRYSQQVKGEGLHDALAAERLRRARLLLSTTDLPVSSIAEQTGFTDVSHLDLAFRRSVGLKPSAFRKLSRSR